MVREHALTHFQGSMDTTRSPTANLLAPVPSWATLPSPCKAAGLSAAHEAAGRCASCREAGAAPHCRAPSASRLC